jgi:hypothetical protein
MRPQLFKPMMLLLLSCQALHADEPIAPPRPQLTVENINKATKVLRDPTVITEKIGQGLEGFALPTVKNATQPSGGSVNKGELKDSTLMNQNFRDALNRAIQNKTGMVENGPGGANIAPVAPVLPKISLLASVWGHKNKNSAMLRINDKTEMVYVGDKITSFENNQLIEIHVLEIQKHHVKITVFPANETIILR